MKFIECFDGIIVNIDCICQIKISENSDGSLKCLMIDKYDNGYYFIRYPKEYERADGEMNKFTIEDALSLNRDVAILISEYSASDEYIFLSHKRLFDEVWLIFSDRLYAKEDT